MIRMFCCLEKGGFDVGQMGGRVEVYGIVAAAV